MKIGDERRDNLTKGCGIRRVDYKDKGHEQRARLHNGFHG